MRNTHSKILRSVLVAVCVALLALAFTACSSSGSSKSSSSDSADITIKDLTFPKRTDVQTGSTVTVKNDDSVTHTVTADDGSFNITIDAGKTGTFTAPKTEGQYGYHCNIHSQMKATLNVQ